MEIHIALHTLYSDALLLGNASLRCTLYMHSAPLLPSLPRGEEGREGGGDTDVTRDRLFACPPAPRLHRGSLCSVASHFYFLEGNPDLGFFARFAGMRWK